MLPHPLTNFEIQKYYQDEPRFNGVYSRGNLPPPPPPPPFPPKKDPVYVITLMSILILELIGLLCMYKTMVFLIMIILE